MTTPKTVDALQEKWTARLGTRVAVHKEERVHQGNSFRYGLYVHSVNTAADMVWPDVWHPAWERGGGAALASLDAALEAKYPEPEPEPFTTTFVFDRSGGIYHSEMCNAEGRPADMKIGIHIGPEPTVVWHTAAELKAALETHEAVKAWEARALPVGSDRKFQAHPYGHYVIQAISCGDAPTIVEAINAALGGGK